MAKADDFAREARSYLEDRHRYPHSQTSLQPEPAGPEPQGSSEDLRQREAGILWRVQYRREKGLTPEVLINIELAAYYLLLLIDVSSFRMASLRPLADSELPDGNIAATRRLRQTGGGMASEVCLLEDVVSGLSIDSLKLGYQSL